MTGPLVSSAITPGLCNLGRRVLIYPTWLMHYPHRSILQWKDTEIECEEWFSFSSVSPSTHVAVALFLCFFPYKIPENPTNPASPNPSRKAAFASLLLVEESVDWQLVTRFRCLTLAKILQLELDKDWRQFLTNGAAMLDFNSHQECSGTM